MKVYKTLLSLIVSLTSTVRVPVGKMDLRLIHWIWKSERSQTSEATLHVTAIIEDAVETRFRLVLLIPRGREDG
jgi:hypothetical protein